MFSQSGSLKLPSLSCLCLILLCFLQHAAEATHIEVFSDLDCQNKTGGWNGPNGYPNGRCTSTLREGNFTTFKIVNPDPGCALTLYAKDTNQDICSGGSEIATPATCYNTTWYYYSIDECFKPGGSSLGASSTSTTSTTSSNTGTPTTMHTHVITNSASASSTPIAHHHGPNIGAIVGGTIGGVAFGVILAAIGIISFIRYRRTKRAKLEGRNGGGSAPPPPYGGGAVEIAAKEASVHTAPTWSSTPAHELGDGQAVELQTRYVHELPDSGRGELGQKSPTGTEGSGEAILGRRGKD